MRKFVLGPSGLRKVRNPRIFLLLEQKHAEKNLFESLVDEAGFERSSQSDLESILVNFYSRLFSKDSLDMQIQTELIDDLEFSLNDLECEQCEGLFTKEELFLALQGLQTGKLPGSDGLPMEFYLAFWDSLCDSLVSVLTSAFALASFWIVSVKVFCA